MSFYRISDIFNEFSNTGACVMNVSVVYVHETLAKATQLAVICYQQSITMQATYYVASYLLEFITGFCADRR